MIKVLHFVTIMNRAGEETFIMNVFRTIDRSKIMFDFLVSSDREGDYDSEINSLGGRIHHISFSFIKGPLKRLKTVFLLYKTLKGYRKEYSAFHIHTQHAMDALLDSAAAKLAGIKKVIVHSHSTQTLFHQKAHIICRPFLNMMPIYRFACSLKAGEWLFGIKGKFEVINNGIIIDNYLFNSTNRETIRKQEGWGSRTIIGHVGSFTYPKNHIFMVDIFNCYLKYNSEALLVMAGNGELLKDIELKVKSLGISDSIVFLGGRDDVNKLYSAFDILLFPSHYEGLPVTLVEAQAAGLPCLISDAITKETDIIPSLTRMSLNETAESWALQLITMLKKAERPNCLSLIEKAGFDIKSTTSRLSELYSS